MIPADSISVAAPEVRFADSEKFRRSVRSESPAVLADVFEENVNIAIWQRELFDDVRETISSLTQAGRPPEATMTVSPQSALAAISESLGTTPQSALSKSIAELVDMFCDLLGLERAGLRLRALDSAMCPRFHVDRVPCRLVTTYLGAGTEWLQHSAVDRSKLGLGSGGRPDHQSGLLKTAQDIEQLRCGDVALLKGELWEGNEGGGLVHRSPAVAAGDVRLLMTLDVCS